MGLVLAGSMHLWADLSPERVEVSCDVQKGEVD